MSLFGFPNYNLWLKHTHSIYSDTPYQILWKLMENLAILSQEIYFISELGNLLLNAITPGGGEYLARSRLWFELFIKWLQERALLWLLSSRWWKSLYSSHNIPPQQKLFLLYSKHCYYGGVQMRKLNFKHQCWPFPFTPYLFETVIEN